MLAHRYGPCRYLYCLGNFNWQKNITKFNFDFHNIILCPDPFTSMVYIQKNCTANKFHQLSLLATMNMWIGLVIIILLIVIICLIVADNSDDDHESPYHWSSHYGPETLTITPGDSLVKRFSLGPQYITYASNSTGATGATEAYLMPMEGTLNCWAASAAMSFATVPTGSFPISVTLKAIKYNCTGAATEHVLLAPITVDNSTQSISLCETFRSALKFRPLDRISVVVDIERAEVDPQETVNIATSRLFVSAIAEWCGCTCDTDCCSVDCTSCSD